MVAEFPDSLPSLRELKQTASITNNMGYLGKVFRATVQRRLLHMGASTSQILVRKRINGHFILTIKSFESKILDIFFSNVFFSHYYLYWMNTPTSLDFSNIELESHAVCDMLNNETVMCVGFLCGNDQGPASVGPLWSPTQSRGWSRQTILEAKEGCGQVSCKHAYCTFPDVYHQIHTYYSLKYEKCYNYLSGKNIWTTM